MTTLAPKTIAVLIAVASLCVGAGSAAAADEPPAAAPGDERATWNLALTGGFVTTGLVNPVYALGTVAGQTSRVVVRQPDQESSVNLGVAMFAQVYHDRYAWIAPVSFGIGVRGDSRATFYLGSALRFGSHTSLTAGMAVGPVAALPAGIVEGKTLTDTNFLSDLTTRTTRSWFAGVTYAFVSLR